MPRQVIMQVGDEMMVYGEDRVSSNGGWRQRDALYNITTSNAGVVALRLATPCFFQIARAVAPGNAVITGVFGTISNTIEVTVIPANQITSMELTVPPGG